LQQEPNREFDMRRYTVKAALAAVVAASIAAISPARADTIQLGFILDESGSIGNSEWNTIKNGLSNAINNLIPIGGPNTYEISVFKFDDDAETVVNRVLVNSVASRSAVANTIANMSQQGGSTNYQAAFNLARTVMRGGGNLPTLSFVNFATDGDPNEPFNNLIANQGAAVAARDLLIAAGVDNISIEGIGVSAAGASFLQNSICYPGPCDTTVPYNFPNQGFYIGVANAQGYANAIGNKIAVVTQTPEPATVAILGAGLVALFFGLGLPFVHGKWHSRPAPSEET